ncbi:hypothetical protein MKW98_004404 [Papaver atlanticum]|uniref:Uncharacterized protein n=1 Tax=Papaver atlanticum TaxID=357466 RepID=A0AAD4XIC7_9MAGN|nr:hypothetical protein MKW98_004404 [Papaver atlanticum]
MTEQKQHQILEQDLSRDKRLAALPRALVAWFVKIDKDLQDKARTSGTTVSDNRRVCGYHGLRWLECNEEEKDRITASDGEVGRLNIVGGDRLDLLEIWTLVIVHVPYVQQVKDKYKVYNLCSERLYDASLFEGCLFR